MDRMERLNLLFEGDENLLQARSGNYAGNNDGWPNPPKLGAKGSQLNNGVAPGGGHDSTAQSDSEEGFDEYLKYFAEVHKKNARKQATESQSKAKAKKSNGGGLKDTGAETSPEASWSAVASGIETGGALPPFFCPAIAISRFPYKYVPRELSDPIAKRFFDGGKFWSGSWELYYVHPPPDISNHPLLLIPATQVQKLITSINRTFKCDVSIPTGSDEGLLIPFSEDGTPQPKFLGLTSSREMKEELERCIRPPRDGEHLSPDGSSPSVDRSFEAFRKKMDTAVDATRRKNKASKAKRREVQIKKQQDWCRSLKRLQCYLGLLPRYPRGLDATSQEQDERNYGLDCGTVALALDVNKEVAFPYDREPIFISVDVESNERCHNQITEIGISTLDTRDLVGIPPGQCGKKWLAKIRSRHFRISEYASVVNRDFVAGCPDRFEFGQSEWVSIKAAAKLIDSCFQPPYSGHFPSPLDTTRDGGTDAKGGSFDSDDDGGVALDPELPISDDSQQGCTSSDTEPRNIILLGHDTQADVAYLRSLGCDTFSTQAVGTDAAHETPNSKPEPSATVRFLESLDTATLYQAFKREPHTRSLGHILLDLGQTGWFLHNAGNDAYYTMQCMVGVALTSYLQFHGSADEAREEDSPQPLSSNAGIKSLDGNVDTPSKTARDPSWEAEVARRVAETVEDTKARVMEECESWTIAMGQGSNRCVDDIDGGDAKGVDFTPLQKKKGK